ncbi:MAG: TrmB family transcriptional regulator [Firmicutes bacterium]|nr:TrmB family transcriptional regulator [Bacillota bacterium]
MSRNERIIAQLKQFGMTEYESKAYIGLLKNSPVTRYELAKNSGVPLPKIYETLDKMVANGWVLAIDSDPQKYVPLDIDDFLFLFEKKFESALSELRQELPLLAENKASYIWNINEYQKVLDIAAAMIDEAKESIYLSIWEDEAALLKDNLQKSVVRGVQIAAITYGEFLLEGCTTYSHGIKDTLLKEKRRGLSVVVDNSRAVGGWADLDHNEEDWYGVWTGNKGLIQQTREYIKHDIYIWKIFKRFRDEIEATFGNDLQLLRNVMEDRETIRENQGVLK